MPSDGGGAGRRRHLMTFGIENRSGDAIRVLGATSVEATDASVAFRRLPCRVLTFSDHDASTFSLRMPMWG